MLPEAETFILPEEPPLHNTLEKIEQFATGKLFRRTVMLFEIVGLGVAQVKLDVNSQVTRSPESKLEEEKVVLFVPTFPPFTFH